MTKPPKAPSIPRFHPLNVVAERLGLSPRSVRRLIDEGTLASYKIGGAVRVSDDDLVALIARSRQNKGAEG